MKNRKIHPLKLRMFLLGMIVLFFYITCLPPAISYQGSEDVLNINNLYFNVSDKANRPIVAIGQVTASFFIKRLGGFYFLRDLAGKKSIICFTHELPPPEGSEISVFGVVKPVYQNGDINFLYLKTKRAQLLQRRMDQASL